MLMIYSCSNSGGCVAAFEDNSKQGFPGRRASPTRLPGLPGSQAVVLAESSDRSLGDLDGVGGLFPSMHSRVRLLFNPPSFIHSFSKYVRITKYLLIPKLNVTV